MTLCYHQPCDSIRKPYDADFANLEFYKHLVQTLLNSVLELSKASCLRAEHLNRFYDRLDEKENTNEKIDNSIQFSNSILESSSDGSLSSSSGSVLSNSLLTLSQFMKRLVLPFLD